MHDVCTPVRAAIVGASGYSGEELVRLLLNHPRVDLVAVTSRSNSGQSVAQVFPRFASHPDARSLRFSDPNPSVLATQADVVFLALPHGVAAEFAVPLHAAGVTVIDLSADFRLRSAAVYREFYAHEHPAPELLSQAVYGLPEVYRERIRTASLIASPGCYPTSILLPTLPLIRAGLIRSAGIIADSLSGVSGAGRKAEADYLFCECNESVRAYGLPKHRHLSEIEQELSLAAGEPVTIQFTPHLIPVNRGILTTLYLAPTRHFKTPEEAAALDAEIAACYRAAYAQEPFVRVLEGRALPDTKNVVGTNVVELAWRLDPRTGRLLVVSAEDNILKGASGQAIQSMNIRYGFPETEGLL
ncbi:MAG: N-acetyl-gamma-glutamyl-phosphate reductase [Verrucomicrobiales bacterium]|nr:N-acetyl-gamma-glutamyl-phosphate reductase [Verrucomicrobiales bacterium]